MLPRYLRKALDAAIGGSGVLLGFQVGGTRGLVLFIFAMLVLILRIVNQAIELINTTDTLLNSDE